MSPRDSYQRLCDDILLYDRGMSSSPRSQLLRNGNDKPSHDRSRAFFTTCLSKYQYTTTSTQGSGALTEPARRARIQCSYTLKRSQLPLETAREGRGWRRRLPFFRA